MKIGFEYWWTTHRLVFQTRKPVKFYSKLTTMVEIFSRKGGCGYWATRLWSHRWSRHVSVNPFDVLTCRVNRPFELSPKTANVLYVSLWWINWVRLDEMCYVPTDCFRYFQLCSIPHIQSGIVTFLFVLKLIYY